MAKKRESGKNDRMLNINYLQKPPFAAIKYPIAFLYKM